MSNQLFSEDNLFAGPHLPVLLLVDSDVTHIADYMLRAIGRDVTVVQFSSTHAFKTWISLHTGSCFAEVHGLFNLTK